ncbi:MAG: hypothetical protein DRK00_10910, partial [Thermoprotei archaeon]
PGKREVVGNLVAAQLSRRGVGFFSFGEYFESRPLLEILKPEVVVKDHTWIDGVAYRALRIDDSLLRETLAAHHDSLLYRLEVERGSVELEVRGNLMVFSWFLEERREEIAAMALASFSEEGRGVVRASYRDVYELRLAVNPPLRVEVRPAGVEYRGRLTLGEGEALTLYLTGAPRGGAVKPIPPQRVEEEGRRRVREMLGALRGRVVEPRYELLWRYMWYVILSNRAHVEGHPVLKRPFNMPSKLVYRHQWLWDSAFHAIVLSSYDVRMAEEELMNLYEAQKPDGRIPHEVFLSKEFCKLFWSVDDYSPWTTQPPVLAIAVEVIRRRGGSREFLEESFKALDRYDRWLREQRDSDRDQLIAYVDYLESGWDNSVRWDEAIARYKRSPETYRGRYREVRMAPVEAVDLNAYVYLQRRILAKLARSLGLEDEAEEYGALAEETRRRVLSEMWDEETGFFYDIWEDTHEHIKVKTPAAFTTLYAGIATEEQARRLVEHLLNPGEFWTRFPLPTVSADDPRYDPSGYWRGASWLNMLWLTYWGLRRYGFNEEARKLAERALEHMARGPTCSENYDSSTGAPMGAPDFGWSTLMITIIEDLSTGQGVDAYIVA